MNLKKCLILHTEIHLHVHLTVDYMKNTISETIRSTTKFINVIPTAPSPGTLTMAAMSLNPVSLTNLLVCSRVEKSSSNNSLVMNGWKEEPHPLTACFRALCMGVCRDVQTHPRFTCGARCKKLTESILLKTHLTHSM